MYVLIRVNRRVQQLYNCSSIKQDINKDKTYIIVMLSGDAPNQQQKMKFFTIQSADHLFTRVIFLLGDLSSKGVEVQVIIQNGPRTGKHDPETGNQICLHKFNNGQDPSHAIDTISSYFINKLQNLSVPYLFYNFSFQIFQQKRVVNSFYKPLLYVAQQKNNLFLFPMESVSMCSQLPYYIDPSRLIAYHTSSTNENHMKFVQEGFKRGLYNKINEKSIRMVAPENKLISKYDQTQNLVQQIVKNLKLVQILN